MANPKMILSIAIGKTEDKEEKSECLINELVEKVFATGTLLHFSHLTAKSYTSHVALGDMYDKIIDLVDEICEVYMGKFGLLKNLECDCARVPSDIVKHIKDEADWVDENRTLISKGYKPVDNLIDGLLAEYSRTVYKLENLK